MNWYKKAQEIYRGDPKPINIQDYDAEYGTKELGKELGSSAAYGPGIYFNNKEDIARLYGENITKLKLNNAKILTANNKPFTYQQITKILNGVSKEKLEEAATNWDENYRVGKDLLIKSILAENNIINQLMAIWAEVFYHQNPNAFMSLMTSNGIDGFAIPKDDSIYYVIYNKSVLK